MKKKRVQKTGNQSEMMFDVFERLTQKHPEKIAALTGLTSVKPVAQVTNAGTSAAQPVYFRICREFEASGTKYYIGASYSKAEKLKQIQKMIQMCDESEEFFRCEGIEAPVKPAKQEKKSFVF